LEDERLLDCISIDEIQNNTIQENEIVFFNWDSLIKDNNVFRMDNETDWNLQNVIANTKEEGRSIILIIDESHRTARAAKAREVIEEIGPALTIEITATPKEITGTLIKIPLKEVIDAGMIKREVQINPGAHNIRANRDLLAVALKKRKDIKTEFESIGVNINPLLLVQIPNKKVTDSSNPEDYIIGLLAENNITVSNGRLAIWLSELKENRELVEQENSSVDVLIFKEAIALGWDCPRAAILFLQREWKQDRYIFNIQTLGRIMRMPEQVHYGNNPNLNIGYIFSASDNFEIVQELASDYVSSLQMERDEDIYSKPVRLESEFIRRKRELTRLSGDFKVCLFNAANELSTKDEINTNVKEIQKIFGVEGTVKAIDAGQTIEFAERIKIQKDVREVTDSYTNFAGNMSSPYAKARSSQIIKSSLRSWFKEMFGIGDEDRIAVIVMHRNNNSKVKVLLERAKELYEQLPTRSEEIVPNESWEIPQSVSIFTDYEPITKANKSILKDTESRRYFVKTNKNGKTDLSEPERKFIKQLESSDDELCWWFKNSYGESKYFSIAYKRANGRLYGFYPDFVLRTKKETLIVEIKDDKDFRADNALKLRAGRDYLRKYERREKIRFNILSPDDFENFFQGLKDQELDKFRSLFEERLLRYNKSNQIYLESKAKKTEKDSLELELLDELDKTIAELHDTKLEKELLQLSLEQAEQNLKVMGKAFGYRKAAKDDPIEVPVPFHVCVLGEVSSQEQITQELQEYFRKMGVATNDWSIRFFNNTKLQNSDILRSLVRGRSRFDLVLTGQIYHHSGKRNSKSNIITELKNEKYVPHVIGIDPKSLLTPDKTVEAVDSFLRSRAEDGN
jgi:type III restriction enzyme